MEIVRAQFLEHLGRVPVRVHSRHEDQFKHGLIESVRLPCSKDGWGVTMATCEPRYHSVEIGYLATNMEQDPRIVLGQSAAELVIEP